MATKYKKHAVVILDETGSMHTQRDRVRKSLNEYVQSLPKGTRLHVFKFNSEAFTKFYSGWAASWEAMKPEDYSPRALTPLYDSIAKAVEFAREQATDDARVMVMIDTDGEENVSTDYTLESVRSLIEARKRDGWEFLFMSSGLDVAAAKRVSRAGGLALGVNTISASHQNRDASYGSAVALSSAYLATGKTAPVGHTVVVGEGEDLAEGTD